MNKEKSRPVPKSPTMCQPRFPVLFYRAEEKFIDDVTEWRFTGPYERARYRERGTINNLLITYNNGLHSLKAPSEMKDMMAFAVQGQFRMFVNNRDASVPEIQHKVKLLPFIQIKNRRRKR